VLTAAAAGPHQDGAIQIEVTLPVRQRRGETRGRLGSSPSQPGSPPLMTRITRLMALAIKFQDMVDRGEVRDYAELARLGYVTRARITQIMNLVNLAPDIQEQLLFASNLTGPNVPLFERQLRPIISVVDWPTQRWMMHDAVSGRLQS